MSANHRGRQHFSVIHATLPPSPTLKSKIHFVDSVKGYNYYDYIFQNPHEENKVIKIQIIFFLEVS